MKKILLFVCATWLVIGAAANVEALSFSPTDGNFGDVEIGNTFSKTFILKNDDDYSIYLITHFLFPSDQFSASSPELSFLIPGQMTTLDVSFTPTSTGIHMAALLVPFLYNDFHIGIGAVGLIGDGIESGSTSVPDASIMLLLGSSLIGLMGFSRKSKRG